MQICNNISDNKMKFILDEIGDSIARINHVGTFEHVQPQELSHYIFICYCEKSTFQC